MGLLLDGPAECGGAGGGIGRADCTEVLNMILIFFRNADGEICGQMRPSRACTLRQVKEEIERFIAEHGGGLKACGRLVRR